jgi:predicted small secreted protein
LVSPDAACFNQTRRRRGKPARKHRRRIPRVEPTYYQEFSMKRYAALLFIALFSIAALSGCNTVKGFGKDVQKVGEKVEDASGK